MDTKERELEISKDQSLDIEKIADLILTSEEYMSHPFPRNRDLRAYVFELEKADKKIVYFGSAHINSPNDPLFDDIRKRFEETNPDMVYIEGWQAINIDKDKVREIVRKQSLESTKIKGEPYFTLKLAVDAGADFECPEPEFSEEIAHLLDKGFSKKDIFYFYAYRNISQYQRENEHRSIEECKEYLAGGLNDFKKASGWPPSETDVYEQEIISDLDPDNTHKYRGPVDPIPWEGNPQTVLNEISRASSDLRERCIIKRIAEGLKNHSRIFVVYGSAHAAKQEPALRAFLDINK